MAMLFSSHLLTRDTIQTMQAKLLLWAVAVTFFLTCHVHADSRVEVLDARGKRLDIVASLKLDRQHLAVPASAFRLLGLYVGYSNTERRIYISIPETDIMVGLRADERRSYHPEIGYLPKVHPYPLARKREGHFYVSVRFMQQAFPDYFTYSWDKRSQTLTLKRRRNSKENT